MPSRSRAAFHKWLRYYLDVCHKYHFPAERQESLPHFLQKLQQKYQIPAQQAQATQAIALYYKLCEPKCANTKHEERNESAPCPLDALQHDAEGIATHSEALRMAESDTGPPAESPKE